MHYLISKALRYDSCVIKRSHCFTCHPHTNHTCLYSPAARHHRHLASTNLYCLVTEAHIGVRNLPRVFTPRARPRLEPTTSFDHKSDTLPTAPRHHGGGDGGGGWRKCKDVNTEHHRDRTIGRSARTARTEDTILAEVVLLYNEITNH